MADSQFAFVADRTTPRLMEKPHSHTHLELNYLLSGSMTYLVAGRHRVVRPRRAAVFWAGMPHGVVKIEGEVEFICVGVPLAWFLQLGIPRPFVERLLGGALVQAGPHDELAAATDGPFFERWVDELRGGDPEARRLVVLEVEARLRRFAAGAPPTPRRRHTDASASQLERLAVFLGDHYRDRLNAADVGRALGLHPNYATTLFKRGLGVGMWEYVLRLRVSHAQRLLLTSELPVEQVARESGFSSSTSFYRTFRRLCGCTPREYRVG